MVAVRVSGQRTMEAPGAVAWEAALRPIAICTSRSLNRSRIQILCAAIHL